LGAGELLFKASLGRNKAGELLFKASFLSGKDPPGRVLD
jgi:hypothetical protein